MNKILVDTNAWIALNNKNDQFHSRAVSLNKELINKGYKFITTNFILDETYTGLLMKVSHYSATDFGERVRSSKLLSVFKIEDFIENSAWEIFKKYSDKQFSYTDCTSFALMKYMNIDTAFTNDHHFEQFGFISLLK